MAEFPHRPTAPPAPAITADADAAVPPTDGPPAAAGADPCAPPEEARRRAALDALTRIGQRLGL